MIGQTLGHVERPLFGHEEGQKQVCQARHHADHLQAQLPSSDSRLCVRLLGRQQLARQRRRESCIDGWNKVRRSAQGD